MLTSAARGTTRYSEYPDKNKPNPKPKPTLLIRYNTPNRPPKATRAKNLIFRLKTPLFGLLQGPTSQGKKGRYKRANPSPFRRYKAAWEAVFGLKLVKSG